MVRLVTDDDIGIKVLREAQDKTRAIDIIAIHGIGAHPDDSWCRNVGTAENPQWVNWLYDTAMLPAVAPHARIMRYGYQSQWFGEGAMRQKASTVAQRLREALRRKRKECPSRPLIFIAHCFGGLVVLKALVDAYHDDEWRSLLASTAGLIFLGTPFRGAEGMKLMEMFDAARREYDEDQVQLTALHILEPGNEYLQEVVDQFGRVRGRMDKMKVACFYELKSSNVGRIVGKKNRTSFVVSESSGCLDVSNGTKKCSLSRDHFNMNKFGKPTEEDFELVSESIGEMVRTANEAVKAHYKVLYGNQIPVEVLGSFHGNQLPQVPKSSAKATKVPKTSKPKTSKPKTSKPMPGKPWSTWEDEELLCIVRTGGSPKWKDIAANFNRSDYACQKRYEKLTENVNVSA